MEKQENRWSKKGKIEKVKDTKNRVEGGEVGE